MKTITINSLSLLFLCLILNGCGSEDEAPPVELSSQKSITQFTINDVSANISEVSKTISVDLPLTTDETSLTPIFSVSAKASASPASGVSQDFSNPVVYTVTAEDGSSVDYTASINKVACANASTVYSFVYNGTNYEIIKEGKSWEDAAACAVERGGKLAEINSSEENEAIAMEASKASIDNSMTVSFDGGGASYLWIGGNDLATEGIWIRDGDNDGNGPQFWQGARDGSSISGLYNNWGNEPDNSGGAQDCLGLALTQWPIESGTLGSPGEWNDLESANLLYYVVEYE